MTLALILFAFTYCLMLALPRFRPASWWASSASQTPSAPKPLPCCAMLHNLSTIGIRLRSMTNLIQKPSSAPQLEG